AANCAPTAPAAPALFSRTTGCLNTASSAASSGRVIVSLTPPGGNGLIIVMARVGYASCARARPPASVAADATVPTTKLRRSIFRPPLLPPPAYGLAFPCLPLNPADRIDGVVGSLAVDVPEFLKVRAVEVIELLARVCE